MSDSMAAARCRRDAKTWAAAAPVSCLLSAICLAAWMGSAAAANAILPQQWIATWAASPQAYRPGPEGPEPRVAGRTIRERMRITIGGDELRVRISNEFGTTPLVIGGATAGIPTGAGSVAAGSLRTLTFSGHNTIVVPPGAPVLSDPVKIALPHGSDVSISLYLPQTQNMPLTLHTLGLRTAVISPPGNFVGKLRLPQSATTTSSVFVTALLVPRQAGQFAIVALGDSITDGNASTVDALRNWPDDFARRLQAAGLGKIAIVDEGISGNQLRHDFAGVSAQARFDRDVLATPGARYVIVLEGINDIGFPGVNMMGHMLAPWSALPTANDLITAYRQLIARAHAHGLQIIGATLTPFRGTFTPYYTDSKEKLREAVNQWIRTSGAFDGVIDFDAALRDPQHPHRYLPRYSSPDHLHPSDAGYQAMADAVSLRLFRKPAAAREWIATWGASPQQAWKSGPPGSYPDMAGRTLRERMRVTIGGDELRVRLSNEFGTGPLVIGSATIGIPTGAASVARGSLRTLTFSGQKSIVVPPGAPVLSDPVSMHVPAGSDISISLYCPQTHGLPLTLHATGLRTAVISPPGDFTSRVSVPQAFSTTSSLYATALLVPRSQGQDAIVAFGDSITDGHRSTVDALRNWPDDFARRVASAGLGGQIAIVNEGIGGNQLRHDFAGVSAEARFDRDVLAIPGARYVVLLEGINDLGFPGAKMMGHLLAPPSAMPSAEDIIAAYRQLIARAHAHGLKIIGATLTPWQGTDLPGYYTAAKEPIREAINRWIRASGAFDAVIDFDAALRDPGNPHRLLPRDASSDHLHPSDAGYQAMANAVRLSLFGH